MFYVACLDILTLVIYFNSLFDRLTVFSSNHTRQDSITQEHIEEVMQFRSGFSQQLSGNSGYE